MSMALPGRTPDLPRHPGEPREGPRLPPMAAGKPRNQPGRPGKL